MGQAALAGAQLGISAGSAYGQIQQGKMEKRLSNLQADALEMQATDAIARGAWESTRRRRDTLRLVGSQRAGMAAQGLDVSSGSPAAMITESETVGALDALMIKTNAAREAWGYSTQAKMTRYEGKMKLRAAKLGAFNTLLGGGAQAASTAMMAK